MVNIFYNLNTYFCLDIAGKVCTTSGIHNHNSNFPYQNPQNYDEQKEPHDIRAGDESKKRHYNGGYDKQKADDYALNYFYVNIIS
jgi:hypothetical protein